MKSQTFWSSSDRYTLGPSNQTELRGMCLYKERKCSYNSVCFPGLYSWENICWKGIILKYEASDISSIVTLEIKDLVL